MESVARVLNSSRKIITGTNVNLANTRLCPNVVLLLALRLRRCPNSKNNIGQCPAVFAGQLPLFSPRGRHCPLDYFVISSRHSLCDTISTALLFL